MMKKEYLVSWIEEPVDSDSAEWPRPRCEEWTDAETKEEAIANIKAWLSTDVFAENAFTTEWEEKFLKTDDSDEDEIIFVSADEEKFPSICFYGFRVDRVLVEVEPKRWVDEEELKEW